MALAAGIRLVSLPLAGINISLETIASVMENEMRENTLHKDQRELLSIDSFVCLPSLLLFFPLLREVLIMFNQVGIPLAKENGDFMEVGV